MVVAERRAGPSVVAIPAAGADTQDTCAYMHCAVQLTYANSNSTKLRMRAK